MAYKNEKLTTSELYPENISAESLCSFVAGVDLCQEAAFYLTSLQKAIIDRTQLGLANYR